MGTDSYPWSAYRLCYLPLGGRQPRSRFAVHCGIITMPPTGTFRGVHRLKALICKNTIAINSQGMFS